VGNNALCPCCGHGPEITRHVLICPDPCMCQTVMPSLTRKTMVLWKLSLMQLATRECWRHSSSSLHIARLNVIWLMIGLKLPRKPLMSSGPVMHVSIPLKTLHCLSLPLSLRRKFLISSGPVTHVVMLLKTTSTLHYLVLLLLVKTKVILGWWLMERLLCTMSCLRCFANLGVGCLLKHWRVVQWDSRCSSHEPDWKGYAYFPWFQWCHTPLSHGKKEMLLNLKLFSESQYVEDAGGNITELQHILHTILPEAIDSPLDKTLEKHGFTTVQDVLLSPRLVAF